MLIWRRRTEYSTTSKEAGTEACPFILEEEEPGYGHEYWNPLDDHEFSSGAVFCDDRAAGEEESFGLPDDNHFFDDELALDDTGMSEWEEVSGPDYAHEYWNPLQSDGDHFSDVRDYSELSWESGFAEDEVTGRREVESDTDDTAFDEVAEDEIAESDHVDTEIFDSAFDDIDEGSEYPLSPSDSDSWDEGGETVPRGFTTDFLDEDMMDLSQRPSDQEDGSGLFEFFE
jgi:hypothetical protein